MAKVLLTLTGPKGQTKTFAIPVEELRRYVTSDSDVEGQEEVASGDIVTGATTTLVWDNNRGYSDSL